MTRSHTVAAVLAAALLAAALVLGILVAQAAGEDVERRIEVGGQETLRSALYGRQVVVQVPGAEVTVLAGDPVGSVETQLLEDGSLAFDDDAPVVVTAEDDGLLVPVSYELEPTGDPVLGDPPPATVRLVAGDRTVDLGAADIEGRDVVVAVDGGLGADDLAVEVEVDGVTQAVDVATGEIDAGRAAPLYRPDADLRTGCRGGRDNPCVLEAPADSPLRPAQGSFTASAMTVTPYDRVLGWADEGSQWASVGLQLLGVDGLVDADGAYRVIAREDAPVVTLDGAEPAHREGLVASTYGTTGRVVFRVATDEVPRELVVEQRVTPAGSRAPRSLTLADRVELVPSG